MKKILITITLFFFFAICFSQQKQVVDTNKYVADTVNTVSVADMISVLKYIEDKVTKKEYDAFEKAYGVLLQATEQKRRKIKK